MLTLNGTEVSLSYIQCFLYLVSSSINVSIFHITWLDTFWTDCVHLENQWKGLDVQDSLFQCLTSLPISLQHPTKSCNINNSVLICEVGMIILYLLQRFIVINENSTFKGSPSKNTSQNLVHLKNMIEYRKEHNTETWKCITLL